MALIHYKASAVVFNDLPGMKRFRTYFRLYGPGVMPLDRSGVIKFPIKTKNLFPLPELQTTKTYEELCDDRAVDLLARAEGLDSPLYTFWSGGIDSTTVLVSLLKNCTQGQKERIVVLMSQDSIREYPDFFYGYIRGKLATAPAAIFPHLIGTNSLLVSGEHNDQLFGSDVIASAIQQFGFDLVMAPYKFSLFAEFFGKRLGGDMAIAEWYAMLFKRLGSKAPVELKTNYDHFWWINFSTKWQNVYMRMLSYARRGKLGNLNYYAPFFSTVAFQLWSMNNLDKKIRGDWRGYKFPAKDVIYDFTKDAFYRDNKIKLGSLKFLCSQQTPAKFIDEHWVFHKELHQDFFYEGDNDFI